jgi:hypothetical protein
MCAWKGRGIHATGASATAISSWGHGCAPRAGVSRPRSPAASAASSAPPLPTAAPADGGPPGFAAMVDVGACKVRSQRRRGKRRASALTNTNRYIAPAQTCQQTNTTHAKLVCALASVAHHHAMEGHAGTRAARALRPVRVPLAGAAGPPAAPPPPPPSARRRAPPCRPAGATPPPPLPARG